MSTGRHLHRRLVACAWTAAFVVLVGPAHGAPRVHRCDDGKGGVTIQEKPCHAPAPPAARPLPVLTCSLAADELRRAAKLEDQFLVRYPDEATHRRAEYADLQPIATRIDHTLARLAELTPEYRRIQIELDFVPRGGTVPPALQARVDASIAQFAALAEILRGLDAQVAEIAARYGCQRRTLGVRWSKDAAIGASACVPACAGS